MTDRYVVKFADSRPTYLTIQGNEATLSEHLPAADSPDLTLSTGTGNSVVETILATRMHQAPPNQLFLNIGRGNVAHPPYDVGPQDSESPGIRGASLTIQHIKRQSVVGTLRYFERVENGILVAREWGIANGFDVAIESTFSKMIETHAAGINVDGFGGAKVRGRDQAALMLLASVYTSPPFIGHLAQHHLENAHASRLSPFLTTELLRDLKERSV